MARPISITLGCAAEKTFELKIKKRCEETGVPLYKMEKDSRLFRLIKQIV